MNSHVLDHNTLKDQAPSFHRTASRLTPHRGTSLGTSRHNISEHRDTTIYLASGTAKALRRRRAPVQTPGIVVDTIHPPTLRREEANSTNRTPTLRREKANSISTRMPIRLHYNVHGVDAQRRSPQQSVPRRRAEKPPPTYNHKNKQRACKRPIIIQLAP